MSETKEIEKVEEKVEFTPFCDVHDVFDPSETSECVTLCKEDNPDAFEACRKHEESKPAPAKKKKAATGGRGKTVWGHVVGTQAGLIDVCLHEAVAPKTLEEIADFSGGRVPRVLHHLKHLVTDVKIGVVFTDSDKKIFWSEAGFASEIKEETKPVTDYVLRKKAAPKKESAEKSEPEPKKDAEPEPKKDAEPEPKKDAEPVDEKKKPAEKKKDSKKKPTAKKKPAAKKKNSKKAA
jgi:hypothetical protein